MTGLTVPAEAPQAAAEALANRLRLIGGGDASAFALGFIEGIVQALDMGDAKKVADIRTVLVAVHMSREEPAEPTGITYGRGDEARTPQAAEAHYACPAHGPHPHADHGFGCLDCDKCMGSE